MCPIMNWQSAVDIPRSPPMSVQAQLPHYPKLDKHLRKKIQVKLNKLLQND